VPERYPPKSTCHRRFQEWTESGVFAKILTVLVKEPKEHGGIDLSEVRNNSNHHRRLVISGSNESALLGDLSLRPVLLFYLHAPSQDLPPFNIGFDDIFVSFLLLVTIFQKITCQEKKCG
jgi:hypothetical protein